MLRIPLIGSYNQLLAEFTIHLFSINLSFCFVLFCFVLFLCVCVVVFYCCHGLFIGIVIQITT